MKIMKNIFTVSLIGLILLMSFNDAKSAVVYGITNDCATGELVIYVTPDMAYSGATGVWTPYGFTVRWPVALGSTVLGTLSNQNGFAWAYNGTVATSGGFHYQSITGSGATTLAMTSGIDYEVVRIPLNGSPSFGTFDIPEDTDAWVVANTAYNIFSNSNGNQVVSPYPAVSVTAPLVGGVIWDGVVWCGGSRVNFEPGPGDGGLNCYIMGPGAQIGYFNGQVNQLWILAGCDLTINPGFALTANGATDIDQPQGLIIGADPTGSGSFIDNGTVTYGGSGLGSAEVNTFIDNVATVGNFHIHQIGPTVMDPAFSAAFPPETGVFLGAFNILTGSTYAYRWDEPSSLWWNLVPLTDPVPTAAGILLSDVSGSPSNLQMIGDLATAPVNTNNLPPWNPTDLGPPPDQGLNMFSNPFASGLDLTAFFGTNGAIFGFNVFMYVWEHSTGNYSSWDCWFGGGTGGLVLTSGQINPGQGFFGYLAVPYGGVPLAFNQGQRVHLHAPFLKTTDYAVLRLAAEGNLTKDEVLVRFIEGATPGYDEGYDGEKWNSMYELATEIRTIAADQTELTVNTLPPLNNEHVIVPMQFKCGTVDEYTITASEIESFEGSVEIYLEDLQTGGEWYDLVQNPVYTFNASPDDPNARFIVHFFGTLGVDDPGDISNVTIWSYGHDAYIVNKFNENIKEYVVYDMMGREVQRGSLPNTTLNKVFVAETNAYFIVKVITDKNVYSEKVLITK